MLAKYKILTKATPVGILLLGVYMAFWWTYKLDVLPRLHGDEAWVGLKADQFNKTGIDGIYGMNTYTGILQPMIVSTFFKVFGLGIFQLRIAGAVFNSLGLLIIYRILWRYNQANISILFLLILSQSALYLISPGVAWEVNTFTLFFISLLIAATVNLLSDLNVLKPFWILLLFCTNVIGTYNHILFSAISVAALISLILWSLYIRTSVYQKLIALLTCNLLNLILVFVGMRFKLLTSISWLTILFFAVVISGIELFAVNRLRQVVIADKLMVKVNVKVTYICLLLLSASFVIFHGLALFDILSNYKLLVHAYSYPFQFLFRLWFLLGGSIIGFYLVFYLAEDIVSKKNSLYAFFIITYLGIITVYTTNCSFRYYLSIYVIIGLYLALKISKGIKRAMPLLGSLMLSAILINVLLTEIFTHPERQINAIDFKTGNNQMETSAHFLPNKPLIDFLRKNNIDTIKYVSERYFLEQPILFYQLVNPWKKAAGSAAIIDYNYSGNKRGYMLYKEK